MLYDDAEQLEVRYVISLAHHHVSIYGGGETIPEGELWIKRNAICLSRKISTMDIAGSQPPPLPFYLFSENLSEKEDFYFAILNNLEKIPDSPNSPPSPQMFDTKDMITLVQRIHSSEEHLQTRWFNALLGRLFLALYKTPELEKFIWKKISKKISRVKKPNFITKIALTKLNAGEGAPLITNPRLKDLTVDGDCCVEADINYAGNFRVEIAATARIELGARFKPREVDLVLSVVLKKLKGHVMLRFKPPPSNRMWISFETMPDMEMAIEPIVSSRQITYGIILRAIESRIREVVAETVVQPFWDDMPFLDTELQHFRGGIWKERQTVDGEVAASDHNTDDKASSTVTTPEGSDDQNNQLDDSKITPGSPPQMPPRPAEKDTASNNGSTPSSLNDDKGDSASLDDTEVKPELSVSGAEVTGEDTFSTESPHNNEHQKNDLPSVDSDSQIASTTAVPSETMSAPNLSALWENETLQTTNTPPSDESKPEFLDSRLRTDSDVSKASNDTTDRRTDRSDSFASDTSHKRNISKSNTGSPKLTPGPFEAQKAMASIGTAAAAAKKWGWNVLNRAEQGKGSGNGGGDRANIPDHPIGRGRPLPPPGTPLPSPARFGFMGNSITMPKRKAVPHAQAESNRTNHIPAHSKRKSVSRPENLQPSELLVIKAPPNSEPNSPVKTSAEDTEERQNPEGTENSESAGNREPIQPLDETLMANVRPDRADSASSAKSNHSSGAKPSLKQD